MPDELLPAGGRAATAAGTPDAAGAPLAVGEARDFYEALVAQGLIIPTGTPGACGSGARFEQVLDAVNNLITRVCFEDGAELMAFPPVMDRRIAERARCQDYFPLREGEGAGGLVLNPCACYPLLPALGGTLPEGGRLITTVNWIYRRTLSADPTQLQSFRVREFVRVGELEEVVSWCVMWQQRSVQLMHSLGLEAGTRVADRGPRDCTGFSSEDTLSDDDQWLGFDLRVSMGEHLPCLTVGSLNLHEQYLSRSFGILTASGAPAHTACLGFGLQRLTVALFRVHSLEVSGWPATVQERLWP